MKSRIYAGLLAALVLIMACNQLFSPPTTTPESVFLQSATATHSATPNPTPTTIRYFFTLARNSNCRQGPSQGFQIVTTILEGETLEIVGRNFDGTWLYVALDEPSVNCWVSVVNGNIAGSSPNTSNENNNEQDTDQSQGEGNEEELVNDNSGGGIVDWLDDLPIVSNDDPGLKNAPVEPTSLPIVPQGGRKTSTPTKTSPGNWPSPLPFPSQVMAPP